MFSFYVKHESIDEIVEVNQCEKVLWKKLKIITTTLVWNNNYDTNHECN